MKQVIVVRKDLKMRSGKIAAQVAHASMKVLLDRELKVKKDPMHPVQTTDTMTIDISGMEPWLHGAFTKICVYVESEEDLLEIVEKAKMARLPNALIKDAGLTEFHGVPTLTCAAIGPADNDKLDLITGHLKLL